MNLTVDNSVAIKWNIEELGSAAARKYLPYEKGSTIVYNHTFYAPELIVLEFHNTLSKLISFPGKTGKITYGEFSEATIFGLQGLNIDPIDTRLLYLARSISIGARSLLAESRGEVLKHQPLPFNIYDCVYVAHARLRGFGLLTADKEQADIARLFNIPVEFVSAE